MERHATSYGRHFKVATNDLPVHRGELVEEGLLDLDVLRAAGHALIANTCTRPVRRSALNACFRS